MFLTFIACCVERPEAATVSKVLLTWLVPARCPGTWILGGFPSFPDKNGSQCLNCLYSTMWFMLNTCFPSGSLEFWYTLGRGCRCEESPVKTLGADSLTSFSGWQHFTHPATTVPREIKESCVIPLGEASGSLYSVSSKLCPHVSSLC